MLLSLVLMTAILLGSFHLPRVFSAPIGHRRQLPSIEISWVTEDVVSLMALTTTVVDVVTVDPPVPTSTEIAEVTDTVISSVQVTVTSTDVIIARPTQTLPLAPILSNLPQPLPSLLSTVLVLATPTSSPPIAVTITETPSAMTTTAISVISETSTTTVLEPPTTVTVLEPPTTVTETVSVEAPTSTQTGKRWAPPLQFSDLSSFAVTNFACGENNLKIVNEIPASAVSPPSGVATKEAENPSEAPPSSGSDSSMIQLFYPAGSINPGNSPVGGADFYGAPLPMEGASNVSLEYSVFFPADFDWVEGGKLPGIYGGHMQCSGGDDAKSCFSTRLMWRKGGAGELYLYAPKDKQTSALCSAPPLSVCDEEYGLSVGRGSFHFKAGAWSHIRQTVTLNTPGQQDGGFQLEVDGMPVMDRRDVFYRDVPSRGSPGVGPGDDQGDDVPNGTASAEPPKDTGGVLSPLLGGILGSVQAPVLAQLQARQALDSDRPVLLPEPTPLGAAGQVMDDTASALVYPTTDSSTTSAPSASSVMPTDTPPATSTTQSIESSATHLIIPGVESLQAGGSPKPIQFSGLFFSTFFGGNSAPYATPRDQYSWFKNFAITINA